MARDDFVCLSHLWQSRCFMNMPPAYEHALFRGMMRTYRRPTPTKPDVDVRIPYRDRCEQLIRGGHLDRDDVHWGVIKTALSLPVATRFAFPKLTIDDFEVEVNELQGGEECHIRLTSKEREAPRWGLCFETYAFGCFWALFYHLSNEFLRRPHLILAKINEHYAALCAQFGWNEHDEEKRRAFLLAIYERCLGLMFDFRSSQPHYVTNIVRRPGYQGHETLERPTLFIKAVRTLLGQIVARLS